MSSSALHMRPEDIDNIEKRGKYTVAIIGCKETGILHACLFLRAGFGVVCADPDQTITSNLARGKASFLRREIELDLKKHLKTGRLSSTNDIKKATSQSDIIAITSPARIDKKKKVDYSSVENACRQAGSALRRGSVIIIMTATGVGMIEGSIKGTLENASGFKAGIDFGLAFSPFQIWGEIGLENITNRERIVAAVDKASLDVASTVLQTVSKNSVRKTTNVKLTEAATLFDATQRDVDVALVSELALFCEKVGVDYLEARRLMDANSDPKTGLRAFAYENLQEEPYSLLEDAENLNLKLRIASAARETNEEMAKHAVNLTKDALRSCGKTMRRARISLLGISREPNTRSPPRRIAKELAAILEARGARVGLYDPYLLGNEPTEMQRHFHKSLTEAVEGKDCLLILAEHEQLRHLNLKKLKVVMKMPAAIVDLVGIIEPDNVEKEGFIYRGFGRGVWTK